MSSTISRLITINHNQNPQITLNSIFNALELGSKTNEQYYINNGNEILNNESISTFFKMLLFSILTIFQNIILHTAYHGGFNNVDYISKRMTYILNHLTYIEAHIENSNNSRLSSWFAVNTGCIDLLNQSNGSSNHQSEDLLNNILHQLMVDENQLPNSLYLNKLNHFLFLSEHLISKLSIEYSMNKILTICDNYLEDSSNIALFETSHYVILKFISVNYQDVSLTFHQNFIDRIMNYTITLLKVCDQLSFQQFRIAFESVVSSISKFSIDLSQWCLQGLLDANENVNNKQTKSKTSLTLMSLINVIPKSMLVDYLNSVDNIINDVDNAEIRDDLLKISLSSIKSIDDEDNLGISLEWWFKISQIKIKSKL